MDDLTTILPLLQTSLDQNIPLRLRVTSSSMKPTLEIGDWITVEPWAAGDLKRGDILVIRRATDLLTHRLVATTPAGYYTKGDNQISTDPPHQSESILGRVKTRERDHRVTDINAHPQINQIIGIIGWLESKCTHIHPILRFPFRILHRIILDMSLNKLRGK